MPSDALPHQISPLAETIFDRLTQQFPVCSGSDEFHFFPHVAPAPAYASGWDDFSPEALAALDNDLAAWLNQIDHLETQSLPRDDQVDRDTLRTVLQTLREQLTDVGWHRIQPTWYLTILGIGLADAVTQTPTHLADRLRALPHFLGRARQNLVKIPLPFRDLGCDMVRGLLPWIQSLPADRQFLKHALQALEDFQSFLETVPVSKAFLTEPDLYERIASHHMGCFQTIDDIAREQDDEIRETRTLLEQHSRHFVPGASWQAALESLPAVVLPEAGVGALYQAVIAVLADHCAVQGLVTKDFLTKCPVRVTPIPDFMQPVRSNAAYSMPAGHPPAGGTFFILETGLDVTVPTDYRLLTAHETFPGHHLLDSRRWEQMRPVRRHVEFPIFYEGWASFSEELLFDTGFFHGPTDELLMAKRRFWRAMRGRTDLDIHTRRKRPEKAVAWLVDNGLPARQAARMVERYTLKPGYQIAYTMGRRRFRRLYQNCGGAGDPAAFAEQVLAQGEIRFAHLEEAVNRTGLP